MKNSGFSSVWGVENVLESFFVSDISSELVRRKTMKKMALAWTGLLVFAMGCGQSKPCQWKVHDKDRPQPVVVTPGLMVGEAPSDAIILFDGQNLAEWDSVKGGPAPWKVENGYMETVKDSGYIQTKRSFGDCQLHIEWATPEEVKGDGQGRGNSGVFLMGKYEVQVLDSYENKTYPDGQAAAVYGQNPPLVNACRKPGQWQSYDIVFRRPVFNKGGKVVKPARITVFHNGIVVQDAFEIQGETAHKKRGFYKAHPDALPLALQDHGNPIRYRNIWIRGK